MQPLTLLLLPLLVAAAPAAGPAAVPWFRQGGHGGPPSGTWGGDQPQHSGWPSPSGGDQPQHSGWPSPGQGGDRGGWPNQGGNYGGWSDRGHEGGGNGRRLDRRSEGEWSEHGRDGQGGGWPGQNNHGLNHPETVTASTIQQDHHAIDSSVYSLRQHLTGYDGSALAWIGIWNDFSGIESGYRQGWGNCGNRPNNFTTTDSTSIVKYMTQTLGNDIPAAVDELKAHKETFQQAGQASSVAQSLNVLQYWHGSFSAILTSKLTASTTEAANMVQKVHDSLESGIDAFSS